MSTIPGSFYDYMIIHKVYTMIYTGADRHNLQFTQLSSSLVNTPTQGWFGSPLCAHAHPYNAITLESSQQCERV